MRSVWWFVAAGAIAVAGIAGAVEYAVSRIGGLDSTMQRVVVPGTAVLDLDQPGTYTIYHERRTFVAGQYYDTAIPTGLHIVLSEADTDREVGLAAAKYHTTYSIGERQGRSFLQFAIDRPGRYRLSAELPSSKTLPSTVIAIDPGTPGRSITGLFRLVGVCLAFVFSGFGIAGLIVVVTVMQRDKAKRAALR